MKGRYFMVLKLSESNGYGVSEMIYQVLDGHYLSSSGGILESTIQDEVWEKLKKKYSKEITNKRRTVTAIVWQAFIDVINYYGNEEFGKGYGWKMDQKAVQRWFKRNGVDYKEVLKPVVDSVEELRNERLGKKESVSMKESSDVGFDPVAILSIYLEDDEVSCGDLLIYEDESGFWWAETCDGTSSDDVFDTYFECVQDAKWKIADNNLISEEDVIIESGWYKMESVKRPRRRSMKESNESNNYGTIVPKAKAWVKELEKTFKYLSKKYGDDISDIEEAFIDLFDNSGDEIIPWEWDMLIIGAFKEDYETMKEEELDSEDDE